MVFFLVKSGGAYGIGHLRRVLFLSGFLREKGIRSFVALQSDESPKQFHALMKGTPSAFMPMDDDRDLQQLLIETPSEVAVLDAREVRPETYRLFEKRGLPIISLDDLQFGLKYAEASVCALPHFEKKGSNFDDLSYIPFSDSHYGLMSLPLKQNTNPRILVSFGGADKNNIALRVIDALYDGDFDLTLVEGPLADYSWVTGFPKLRVLHSPENLATEIYAHDIIFTTVGLTLTESLSLQKSVITMNPSSYHNKIAAEIPGILNLGEFHLVGSSAVCEAVEKADVPQKLPHFLTKKEFSNWWVTLVRLCGMQGAAHCPVCGSQKRIIIERREEFTLFYCKHCRSNYQYLTKPEGEIYSQDYFENRYEKAYGKSYEEDIDNIRGYSARRLSILRKMTGGGSPKLLDVGAGLGVFVDEANQKNFNAQGAEISEFARKFAKDRFGLKMFESFGDVKEEFDAVTMWFSLEHVSHPDMWLKHASLLLPKGGVLALGLPNGNGLYASRNRLSYLQARPVEHRFEPSTKGMKTLLAQYGFEMEHVQYFGIHPKRGGFPDWKIVKSAQKILGKGDTFEIYARKVAAPNFDSRN